MAYNRFTINQIRKQFGIEIIESPINQQEGSNTKTIYGCVTTGSIWRFLKLEQKQIWIDEKQYFIEVPELVLGILVQIIKRSQASKQEVV